MKIKKVLKLPLIAVYGLVGKIFNFDKRIAKRLPDYFPTYRSFFGELANQLLRCAGSARSFLPQGVVIEPTNNCNLKCAHCSARINGEPRGYMDYDFYKGILDANPQITCLMLSRYGEPFLHPRIFDMIEYAKKKGIYVLVYTNGSMVSPENIDRILASGLDEINFSMEGVGRQYEENRGIPYNKLRNIIDDLLKKRAVSGSKLKIGITIARIDSDDNGVDTVKREWGGKIDYIDVEPLIGTKSPERKASCRTLWRNAVVRWDGAVFPCCIDMKAELCIGDLKNSTLKEIFNSPKALSLRSSHLKGAFPEVCKYCDNIFG